MTLADLQRQLKRCQENLNDATRELERLEFVRDAIEKKIEEAQRNVNWWQMSTDDTLNDIQKLQEGEHHESAIA
ncbi:hypothetical protein EDM54_12950 [Brevibacillus borstelensis]|jgi:peptidoglycan hydrolase CwlO-like protein|uniref:hypothetical protein n=1 Tax=Brevibacillus borstelensis TaxID=45462 RepID=UPI000F073DF1|nr:hypothetical protein [Brevibacillus borstelensis]MED1881186.1 hypothetical protein [Brevibacillus borstelensis]RNB62803.1 hypothetical protein EDM54_12950 [Brevibacillus borstelensis]GED55854.1 hypothetical protein BBO01nite_50950 [Brevibacillus borstelensis]